MVNGCHAVLLKPSRDLCGTTPEEFGGLLTRLAPLVNDERKERDERPERKRAPGGGAKPNAFGFRLFVTLTHLRQGSTTRSTADTFGIHERSVRRYRNEVVRLLAKHGCQPPGSSRPIRTLEDLKTYLENSPESLVLIDATEVPRSSPKPWEQQKEAYSGKSKGHVVKGTVVADAKRRPLYFEANPSGEGRTHDITMLRNQTALLAVLATAGVFVMADRGYQGLSSELGILAILPRKRPRNGEVEEGSRDYNHGQSSVRIRVEHAIGRMKWWRSMRDWRRLPSAFDETGKAIATLASLT